MLTHYQGAPEEVRAFDALVKLTCAANAVNGRRDGLFAEANLSTSQFGVLEALLHLGPLCQKDLAAKLLKSDGNLTMVVGNLEKRGLISRKCDAADKRLLVVQLTMAGRKLIRGLFPRHAANVAKAFAGLASAEQETLGKLAKKLGLAQADA